MSDLEMLTGLGELVTIGGKQYRLPPINRRDWALVKEHILALRADPVGVVTRLADHAPPDVAKALFERAYDDATRAKIVTSREFDEFVYSLEGQQFTFWLRMRRHHPDVTQDEAAALQEQFAAESFAELTKALMKQFPESSQEEIEKLQAEQESEVTMAMVSKGLGYPEGNPSTPEKPGTPTSLPSGAGGTPS